MKRHLHRLFLWLFFMIANLIALHAQTKVTDLGQLKAGMVVKIYPYGKGGDDNYSLSCGNRKKTLSPYEEAGEGNEWTLKDAGGNDFYIKNDLDYYWPYHEPSTDPLTCTMISSQAVKVSLTWDNKNGGVCFWNKKDGKGLNNLWGYNKYYSWYSSRNGYNSDTNTTFEVYITDKIVLNGVEYKLNDQDKTAMVCAWVQFEINANPVIPEYINFKKTTYKVTELAPACFKGCNNLRSITLPESITSLGDSCFYSCQFLENVTLPNSITSLAASCFEGCYGLTNITLPNSITSLGTGCFKDCRSLTEVTLPKDLTALSRDFFNGCSSLTNIALPENIKSLEDNCFSNCEKLTNITLPKSINSLGAGCFKNSGLTSITLPEGITILSHYIFDGCSSLTDIRLPSTLRNVEWNIFDLASKCKRRIVLYAKDLPGCDDDYFVNSETTLYVPKEALDTYRNNRPWNQAGAIYGGEPIVSIGLPSEFSLTKTDRKELAIECSVSPVDASKDILKWSTNDTAIASVDKNGVVTANKSGDAIITATVDDGSGLSASTTIHVTPLLVSNIDVAKEVKLHRMTTTTIEVTVTPKLADNKKLYWSSEDDNIATVSQDGVVKGVNVGTTNIMLKATDGSDVSATCKVTVMPVSLELSTKTISLQQGGAYSEQEIKVIPEGFEPNDVSWITTDASVATIDASGMIKAVSPGVATIRYTLDADKSIYADCKVIVYANSVVYVGGLYYLLHDDGTATVTGIYGAKGNGLDASKVAQYYSGTINIPRSVTYNGVTYDVTNVGSYSFACQNDLQSVFIPTSVKTIEQFASTKAEKLQLVNVEEDSQLINIGNSAFKECTGLRFFTFEGTTNKMKSIDASAFYGCSKLERIKWIGKSTLTTIGDYAFYKCASLNNLMMPNSVLSVGNYSFRYCSGLADVSLSSTLSIIYEYAFGECGFSHITLPESLVSVQAGSFINNEHLQEITIPERMEGIGSAAFENNSSLETVTFRTEINTMTIGDNAFNLCPALSKVNISHLNSWAHTNFQNAKANPANTSHNIYMNGVEIIDVVLPEGTRYVNNNAFNGCSHIKSLSMPKTIDRINDNIIYGCSALKDVYCYAEDVPVFIGTHDPADMDDVFKSTTLHVLYGKESAYKADSWWGRFAKVDGCDEPQVEPVKVSSITISQTSATLKVDDTIQLTATAYPTDADNRKIKWYSSNEDVAMVTDEGFVLAIAEGTSDITAEATDGSGVKAICQVKVEKKQGPAVIITQLEFESSAVTIEQGKPVQLLVKYYPENATNKQLNWTSAKPSVATVDENGVVTGVGEGKTIISAKTTDGSNLTINCVVTVVPATGIGNISMGDVKLLVKNRHLQVIGLADNDAIKVVNAIGYTVYEGTEHEVNLQSAGIYIVKVKGKTLKISVK